jgi:ADP-heptose:LPS heptosyltransferase
MDVPPPKRILLVRLSHLGDVIHGLPVLHGLRRAWPQAELGWVVQPEFAGILEGLTDLDRVFHFDRRGGLGAWLRLRKKLRGWAPDWSVDAQGNAKSAAVTWCGGAPTRLGYARRDWREPLFARGLSHPAAPAAGPHALHRVSALLERVAAGAGLPGLDLDLDPDLSAVERELGATALGSHLPPGDGPLWLLHLGVEGDPRSWPSGSWAKLAEHLASAGGRVLLLSGPAEEDTGRELARRLPPGVGAPGVIGHWVGQRGLRALAATLAAATKLDARFVGTDSGPMHLAAAVGLPVTLLSGPQDPDRTGPWPLADSPGSPHQVLRAVGGGLGPIADLDPRRVATALLETP